MNASRLLAVGMMVLVSSIGARADGDKDKPDYAKLLIGKWEVTKCDDKTESVGAVAEFGKDGKVTLTPPKDVPGKIEEQMYTLEGDTITIDKKAIKIKKMSETVMILDAEGRIIEFKRMK